MQARRIGETEPVADRELEAPAAEIRAESRARIDQHACPHRFEDQLRLADTADNLDGDTCGLFNSLGGFGPVGGLAHRCGRHGDDLVEMLHLCNRLEPPDRVDGSLDRLFGEPTFPCDHIPEAQHLLFPRERDEASVPPSFDHQQMERVATQIQRGDPHGRGSAQRLGRTTPTGALDCELLKSPLRAEPEHGHHSRPCPVRS